MKNLPLLNAVEAALSCKAVILGVGNTFRNDDGAGPLLIKLLKPACPHITLIDGGQTPENRAFDIARLKPSALLIVDAADMGLKVGETELIDEKNIANISFSSHALPLTALAAFLTREVPGLKIYIIGIQPKDTNFGETISPEMETSVRELAAIIRAAGGGKQRKRPLTTKHTKHTKKNGGKGEKKEKTARNKRGKASRGKQKGK